MPDKTHPPIPPKFQKVYDAAKRQGTAKAKKARLEKAQKNLAKLSEAMGKRHAEKMKAETQAK